jgi:hypothetical protein
VVAMATMIERSRQIVRTEGLPGFLLKVTRVFGLDALQVLFIHRTWKVYEHHLENIRGKREEDYLPTIPEMSLKIVENLEEGLKLEREGYDLFKKARKVRDRLRRGAVAFAVFSGKTLVHISWLCLSEEGKNSVNPVPYRLDYGKMGSFEGAETLLNISGNKDQARFASYKSPFAYTYFKRAQYLCDRGINVARYAILSYNTPSQRIAERFGAQQIGRIRLTGVLGLKFWKEYPQDGG